MLTFFIYLVIVQPKAIPTTEITNKISIHKDLSSDSVGYCKIVVAVEILNKKEIISVKI